MKKTIMAVVLAALSMTAAAKDYKYQSVPDDPMQTRIYTLDNGLKVYLSVNREKPRVTAHIAVNTGHRNDPADCTGLAHYLEHLMFKGSRQFGTIDYAAEKPYIDKITALYEEYRKLTDPQQRRQKYHEIDSVSQIAAKYNIPNEYDKAMATIGGEGSNAYTSFDITCYTEDVPANELERWAILQSDRFQNLVMRGFHTELEAVYEEKNISLSRDDEKVFDALMAKLFPSHSYGTQTTIGTQDHLKNPSLVEIQHYYDRYYKPNNIAICMAGDLDCDRTIALIDRYFGSWQPGKDTAPRQFPAQPVLTAPVDTAVVGQEQEQVMLAWRFNGAASLQNDTLSLISDILQNGSCGLIDLDVNQQMLTQTAMAGNETLKDYSVFVLGGSPKEGQTLRQVKDILLAELNKLKAGDFDDDLLVSIINNAKRHNLQMLDYNRARVSQMVDAFINGEDWAQHVARISRMQKITKQDIVAFANRYFNEGYVCAEKLKGEDKNIKKIEKPEITPIPANRELQSQFLKDLTAMQVEPIQPKFVDFSTDLTKATTKAKLPVLYVQNTENDLFELTYRFEFGDRADVRYSFMNQYIPLLGTSTMTAEEIKKQFYKLACDYSIYVGQQEANITLAGLKENMVPAMKLLEQIISDTKADKQVYDMLVDNQVKEHAERKQNQRICFNALVEYGLHGKRNDFTNIMSEQELRNTDPQVFCDLLKALPSYQHTILYYGPLSVKELADVVTKNHKTPKTLKPALENKQFEWTTTPTSEIVIAPYEANNIYMRMFNNELKPLDINQYPVISLFNEYFGGGMNAIVFQELRETRGLAYNANARYFFPARKTDPCYWQQHIISQNDKMMDCINTFKLITDDMPQNEANFNIAKDNIMKSIASARTTKMGIINEYIYAQKIGVDYDIDRKTYEQLPTLKLADLLQFEQQNIKQKPLRYVILGNEKELDMPALEKIAPIKRVTLEDIFGY